VRQIRAADLFCGAGGTSSGLYMAADELGLSVDLLAVNHWKVAIATHSKNHTHARHMCETLDSVDPRKVVPGGRLDLLVASPECTHHSNARGGRPMSDQSRASAWHVIRWAEALRIEGIIVENVREFMSWGPLCTDGRPMKNRRGETFQAWLQALRSLGYSVDYRVLNAADYGDPTTRERLFVLARRARAVHWPEPTHRKDASRDLLGKVIRWRAAREIIEWNLPGTSIFNRKKPLSPNTLRRIAAGLRKFSGLDLEPFLVKLYGTSDAASVEAPVPTVTGSGQHIGVAQPFILQQQSGGAPRLTDEPIPAVAGKGAISIIQPFLVPFFGERSGQEPRVHSVDEPAPAVTSHGAGGLVEPFLAEFHGDEKGKERVRDVEGPLPTVDCANRFGLVQPFLVDSNHGIEMPGENQERRAQSINEPIGTVTGSIGKGLVQPFIMGAGGPSGSGKPQSCEAPIGTVLGENHRGLAQGFLVQYNGTSGPQSVDEPIGTIPTKERFALITIEGKQYYLDIRFRMLTPRELARAQGFPDSYNFTGTKSDVVKQIGNAVPTNIAKALCKAVLER